MDQCLNPLGHILEIRKAGFEPAVVFRRRFVQEIFAVMIPNFLRSKDDVSVPETGIEPATFSLQVSCSTN